MFPPLRMETNIQRGNDAIRGETKRWGLRRDGHVCACPTRSVLIYAPARRPASMLRNAAARETRNERTCRGEDEFPVIRRETGACRLSSPPVLFVPVCLDTRPPPPATTVTLAKSAPREVIAFLSGPVPERSRARSFTTNREPTNETVQPPIRVPRLFRRSRSLNRVPADHFSCPRRKKRIARETNSEQLFPPVSTF